MSPEINFDIPMRERLRKAYAAAVEAKQEVFTFEGHEFVTWYAKYLLQYLDAVLGK
jgi:hypothetical protein